MCLEDLSVLQAVLQPAERADQLPADGSLRAAQALELARLTLPPVVSALPQRVKTGNRGGAGERAVAEQPQLRLGDPVRLGRGFDETERDLTSWEGPGEGADRKAYYA